MRTLRAISIAVLLLITWGSLALGQSLVSTTQPPKVLGLDFSGKLFAGPNAMPPSEGIHPEMVIAGFATPVTCQWGPVDVFWGINPWQEGAQRQLTREEFHLLTPKQIVQRIERIKSVILGRRDQKMVGVVPTFSFDVLQGDQRRRLGFWEFYDTWERYTKWAGPRPWNDPSDWLCIDREGKPILKGEHKNPSPHAQEFHSYYCCIHHPDWTKFQRMIVLSSSEAGYRGAFADDVASVSCYCRHCRRAFRAFLDDSNRPAWVERLAGGKKLSELTLESPDTPAELIRRWRLLSTAVYLETLKNAGKTAATDGFEITAGGLRFGEAGPVAEATEWLLFTDVAAPGIRTTGTLPKNNDLSVGVVDETVKPEFLNYVFRIRHPETKEPLRAKIRLPALSQTGKEQPITVAIGVPNGQSRDNTSVGDFHLSFKNLKTGKRTKVPLSSMDIPPQASSAQQKGTESEDREWAGKWAPDKAGTYEVSFGFTHRPTAKTTEEIPYRAQLQWPRVCRTHQAELLYAQQRKSRPLFVGKEWFALRSPATVRALALCEMAAFGGGGGCFMGNAASDDYIAFLRENRELFDGWRLNGSVGVLYANWGPNPLSAQPNGPFSEITRRLEKEHRPYIALIDRTLPAKAQSLARLQSIYLVSPDYELSKEQIQALHAYTAAKRRIVASSTKTRINGQPAQTILGTEMEIWNPKTPTLPGKPVISGEAGIENVRVAIYKKENRVALHLVNYNVCLLHPQGHLIPVENLTVTAPLPQGWTSARVTAYTPGQPPKPVPTKVAAGAAVAKIPTMQLYTILLLEGGVAHSP